MRLLRHAQPALLLGMMDGGSLERRISRLMERRILVSSARRAWLAACCRVGLAALGVGLMMLGLRPSVVQAAVGEGVAAMQVAPGTTLTFDVASVHENRSGSRDMSWGCRGVDGKTLSEVKDHNLSLAGAGDVALGHCIARNTPLQWIIAMAYGIPWDRENQVILGGPDWVSEGLGSGVMFDIDAKTDQPATRAQLLQMLQTLLVQRFEMKLHQEMRPMPVYELTVAKGGPRLTKAPPSRDCSVAVPSDGPCHDFVGGWSGLAGRSVDMEEFAARLSRYPGHLVVDKTGLNGLYDIKTDAFWMPFPDAPDPGTPTIFHMLEEQFGLQLKTAKDPVQVIVVDSAQRPSAN